MKKITVGIVGFVDYGKTCLIESLTRSSLVTHSEELDRKITIKLGPKICNYNSEYELDEKGSFEIHFIDCPGHNSLVYKSLSVLPIVDIPILVVSALDLKNNQEKLANFVNIFKELKIKKLLIVQTKVDLVTINDVLENQEKLKKIFHRFEVSYAYFSIFSEKSRTNLLKTLDQFEISKKDSKPIRDDLFLVLKSFNINKPGIYEKNKFKGGVVGGIISKGSFKVGDEVYIGYLYTNEIESKKERTTLVKTKILGIKQKESLEEASGKGFYTFELDLDPSLCKSDLCSGSFLFKGPIQKIEEINLITSVSLPLKSDLILNVLHTFLIGSVRSLKKNVLTIKLDKPLPFSLKEYPFLFHRIVNNSVTYAGSGSEK